MSAEFRSREVLIRPQVCQHVDRNRSGTVGASRIHRAELDGKSLLVLPNAVHCVVVDRMRDLMTESPG